MKYLTERSFFNFFILFVKKEKWYLIYENIIQPLTKIYNNLLRVIDDSKKTSLSLKSQKKQLFLFRFKKPKCRLLRCYWVIEIILVEKKQNNTNFNVNDMNLLCFSENHIWILWKNFINIWIMSFINILNYLPLHSY